MKIPLSDSVVQNFLRTGKDLLVSKYKPERLILFGSRATGTAREESDLDILIVSRAFIITWGMGGNSAKFRKIFSFKASPLTCADFDRRSISITSLHAGHGKAIFFPGCNRSSGIL